MKRDRVDSVSGIVSILSPTRFFCPKKLLYIFENLRISGNFSDMSTIFFYFCTIYGPEQNDDKFCTLTNALKGYRSKNNFKMAAIMFILYTKTRFYVSGL